MPACSAELNDGLDSNLAECLTISPFGSVVRFTGVWTCFSKFLSFGQFSVCVLQCDITVNGYSIVYTWCVAFIACSELAYTCGTESWEFEELDVGASDKIDV